MVRSKMRARFIWGPARRLSGPWRKFLILFGVIWLRLRPPGRFRKVPPRPGISLFLFEQRQVAPVSAVSASSYRHPGTFGNFRPRVHIFLPAPGAPAPVPEARSGPAPAWQQVAQGNRPVPGGAAGLSPENLGLRVRRARAFPQEGPGILSQVSRVPPGLGADVPPARKNKEPV